MSDTIARLTTALVDRYRIERELGAGGMATVYLAHDIRHDRPVALKVLRPELAAIIGAERFLSEIRTTANLQHPHILPLHDSGEADGFLFYVMPFVQGETVRDRIQREKQLPVDDAVRIASEVASALDYAHRHGVIHRDIKPENILLHDGAALVADFGIALAASKGGDTRMTETGMSLGTPHYMSPEQAMGERDITARADVYALGCVTYEMLLGEPPFTGPTAQSIVAKVMSEKPAPMISRRNRIPAHVEDAVLTALEKLPADRFGSAAAFAEALQTGRRVAGRSTASGSARIRSPARWKVMVPVAAIAVTTGLFAGRWTRGANGTSSTEWSAELLGGPRIAAAPRVSADGETVAFSAMVDGQTQLAVLQSKTGDWKVLTTDRTKGLIADYSWAPDGSKIYYARFFEVPEGIYSITPLGTNDRLVLGGAGGPEALADGSLLVVRLNEQRQAQMFHYWPTTGKMDTLPATAVLTNGNTNFFRAFPDGREAAFLGFIPGQHDLTAHLYAIDLASHKTRRLAPGHNIPSKLPFSVTRDGKSVIVNFPLGNEQRLVAVPRDGSNRLRVLAVLTGQLNGYDVDNKGNLIFDDGLRPADLRRYDPRTREAESWPIPPTSGSLLPLPDGRVLLVASASGGVRVVVTTPGGDQQPFMAVEQQTGGPLTLLGEDHVALMVGPEGRGVVTIASASTGQLERQIPGIRPTYMSGSRDGRTLFYAESNAIWSIPAEGGKPRRIRDGDAVAADPNGRYLIVQVIDKATVKLFRVPLDGGPETEIKLPSDLRLAPSNLMPNAVGRDGRLSLEVVSPASWYWPTAIFDPRNGALEILPPGLAYDSYGGWDEQGRILYYTQAQESRLWRYTPVTGKKNTH